MAGGVLFGSGAVMGYWVRLTKDGIPDAYSGAWFEGAEWIEGVSAYHLDTCRFDGSEWIVREPEKASDPSQENVEAEYQSAVAQVEAARRIAYQQDADPLFFKWQAGEATEEEWRAARVAVRTSNPMPEPIKG